jgi:hypothetical protein
MAIVTVGNVEVVVRTRAEHCPPHVHAECAPEGWSARFTFSFIADEVALWDFQPERPAREPSRARLNELGLAIYQNLALIRNRWWQVMGTVCLDRRFVQPIAGGGWRVIKARGQRQGLAQVGSARYDPVTQTLTLSLTDGTTHRVGL